MDTLNFVVYGAVCFSFGLCVGAWWAWHWWLRNEKPELRVTVDKEVAAQLSSKMVMSWLDQRGLCWQPKGAVFDLGKSVKDGRD